jgi:hypothetical protein
MENIHSQPTSRIDRATVGGLCLDLTETSPQASGLESMASNVKEDMAVPVSALSSIAEELYDAYFGAEHADRIADYDAIEVHGVRNLKEDGDPEGSCCEIDDEHPQFWSAYLRLKEDGELECVGDFGTGELAVKFAADIQGKYPNLRLTLPAGLKQTACEPNEIPRVVMWRLRFALAGLQELNRRLEGVQLARGNGHILNLEWRDIQEQLVRHRSTLTDFRERAPGNGVDPEAIIQSLGGEPLNAAAMAKQFPTLNTTTP